MAVVSPEVGKVQEIGQQLLNLAHDRRRDVVLVQEGPAGMSFEVPDELYERWMGLHGPDRPLETTEQQDVVAPLKRGPGRPRKYQPSPNGSN
jgi:hypothetical protein